MHLFGDRFNHDYFFELPREKERERVINCSVFQGNIEENGHESPVHFIEQGHRQPPIRKFALALHAA
jgi:hypothetical protein